MDRPPTPTSARRVPPMIEIPLRSNMNTEEIPSLPSSPTASSADTLIQLPFVTPNCSLALQSKRVWLVRNALVASKLATCSIETLMQTVDTFARKHCTSILTKDDYVKLVRSLPEICTGEAFKPMEETLARLFRSFEATNRTDSYQLSTGCLVLVAGDVRRKVEMAIQFSLCGCGVDKSSPLTLSIVRTALSSLLLSISALFDLATATDRQLQSTASIVTTCVDETVARMFAANALAKDATVSFDHHIWPWIDANSSAKKAVSWITLLDSKKWPGSKRLTLASPPASPGKWGINASPAARECHDDQESDVDEAAALSFRFSSVDGGVLTLGDTQALALYELLVQSALTRVHPQAMYDTFVQHTGDGLLEEETFLEAIEELLSMTDQLALMANNLFLEKMLAIFRSFRPETCPTVDAFEIAAGFSLLAWGSKSEKLASAFHYFDADSKGYLNRQQLWRFLRSVLIMLLHLAPPSDNVVHRYGSLAQLVDKGEDEVLEAIREGLPRDVEYEGEEDEDTEDGEEYDVEEIDGDRARVNSDMRLGLYTFEDFGMWYNGGGYKDMSWLELLDLRKWVFFSPSFDLEALDTRSMDLVVASNNYYTANNIQVDVDAVDLKEIDPRGGVQKPYFTFADVIDEEDEEEDANNGRSQPAPLPASMESSATALRSYTSSIPATLPAICLKNELVLEFDLPFDADDDAITELPITTLSYDNGDLIQYFELQRVVLLQQVPLYRVYDVFEPYMDHGPGSCIEKSTFDTCVTKLLPVHVAPSVAAAFNANSHTRIPPRSVGQGKDSKMVADTLSRLFFAFNRGGTGKIDLVEFVSAFTIFCAGSKSEKLAFAYRLFDADGDGCLTRREMWKYLRCFLTMLLALGNGSELSAEAIASVADTTAIEIADCIFKDTDKTFSTRESQVSFQDGSHRRSFDASRDKRALSNPQRRRYEHRGSLPGEDHLHLVGAASHAAGAGAGSAFMRGGVVSFEEFAVWYSKHGYTIIPWIELLDTRKWPEVPRSVSDAILRYISRQQHALEHATLRGNDDTGSGSSNESTNRISASLEPHYPDSDLTALRTVDRYATDAGIDAEGGTATQVTAPTTAAGTKDLSSVALQFRLTSYDHTVLRIRLKDVAIVYTISERMNFSRLTCGDLVHVLKKHAHDRSLTKPGYLQVMRDLVPRDELSNEDQEFLSFHLLRIFTLLESESVLQSNGKRGENREEAHQHESIGNNVGINTISVPMSQLVGALCVFCGTTKSAKLSVLFKLFASHRDGHVSRRRLFEMLKSILVVLFAFSSHNATRGHSTGTPSVPTWSTNSIAERAAGAVVSKLFCEATVKRPDALSLAEFAAWYAAGGYMDCPWLELLDLSKWPAKEAFEASKQEKPLIYAFDMLEEGSILHFTESDISTYLFMLRSTKLGEVSVSKVYDALLAYATPSAEEASKARGTPSRRGQMYSYAAVEEDEGAYLVLSRSNFYECVRSLVSKTGMTEKAQQTSSKLLSRLFNVFDRKRGGRVNALELACGLSILGRGSKSQKLSLAFDFISKMRQQRHKVLASMAVPPLSTATDFGALETQGRGTSGLGCHLGNDFSMGGASKFGLPSTRGVGRTARSGKTRQAPLPLVAEPNALPHSVLFIYLRSFLLALMALSDGTYRLGLEKLYVEADDFIEEAMGDLMTDVSAHGNATGTSTNGLVGYGSARSRARVTFEQFGEWYNTGGYQLISWVELLDVTKWQQQQDFREQTVAMSTASPACAYHSKRTAPVMGSQPCGLNSTPVPMPVAPMQPIQQTVKPVTRRRHVRQSDIVSTPFVRGFLPAASDVPVDSGASSSAVSLSSDGPAMVFAVATDAAELQFFNEDIAALKLFLRQTQLHLVTSWELQCAVLEALKYPAANRTGRMLTRRRTFVRALQHVCVALPMIAPSNGATESTSWLSDDGLEMPRRLLGVFVQESASADEDEGSAVDGDADDEDDEEEREPIDVCAAICGLFVVCKGSMLDKLTCCAALLSTDDGKCTTKGKGDGEEERNDVRVTLETLKSSLACFLMAFYGMSSSLSAEVAQYSAELGAEAVVLSFLEPLTEVEAGKAKDVAQQDVSLCVFTDWFSRVGYPTHPWLELAVLNHWPAAINVCGSNGITDDLGHE